MKKLLLTASITLGFFNFADAAKAPVDAKTEQAEKSTVSSAREQKKLDRKEEQAQKVLETCQTRLKEVEEEGKTLSGLDKKMLDLDVAHATLEANAAKDPDMVKDMMKHARHCRRYLGKAKRHVKKAEKKNDTHDVVKGDEPKSTDRK